MVKVLFMENGDTFQADYFAMHLQAGERVAEKLSA